MSGSRKAISWIVSLAIKRRAAFTAVSGVVLIGAIGLASRTPTRLDMDDFLPVEDGAEGFLEKSIQDQLSGSGRVIVYVEAEKEMTASEAGPIIDELAVRLRDVAGVASVTERLDPAIVRFLEEHGPERFFLYLNRVVLEMVAERLTRESIELALERARSPSDSSLAIFGDHRLRDPLRVGVLAAQTVYEMAGSSRVQIEDGYFSLPGRKVFFLVVDLSTGAKDLDQATDHVQNIEAVFERFKTDPHTSRWLDGKRLSAIGRPISYVSAYQTVSADIKKVGISATLAILLLLALFFRSLLAPFIVCLPVVFGLAVTGTVALIVFGSISLIAWIFAGVLVGLGVDFGLHITSHYRLHSVQGLDRSVALGSALERPGRGILFAALTTAAAFFSLSVISYPVMKQVGVLTGVGLLAILVGSFTVLILVLSFMEPGATSSLSWEKWGAFWSRQSERRPKAALTFWVILLIVAAISTSSIPFEPHPWKLALRGNPKTAELNRLNQQLGASFTPIHIVSRGDSRDEAIARDRSAVRVLKRGAERAGIASIESISNWLPTLEDQKASINYITARPDVFSPERFRRDYDQIYAAALNTGWVPDGNYLAREYPDAIAQFLKAELETFDINDLREAGLGDEMDRFLVEGQSGYVAISYVYLRQFPWAEGVVNRFLETYRLLGGDEIEGVRFEGDALRSAGHTSTLRRDLLRATLLSLILVLGILWFQFRRIPPMVLCLLPALCGIGVALIVMALLQIELNLLTLAIAPIVIGIGVDDGIHIVQRLHVGESFDQLFREAGSSMAMTTLTTVGAFACLGLAAYDGIRELGLVGAIALMTCLFSSLHLVPICYRLVTRDR